jgi:hypothetical protein
MANFYEARNGGVNLGNTLIQARGEIGGSRHVFVKLQRSGNDAQTFPTVGGVVTNAFKGRAKIYAGDFMEFDPGISGDKGATVKILKTYEVAEAATATAKTIKVVKDGWHHIPFAGDILMAAPAAIDGTGTAATVTAVVANGDVYELTLSAALGALKIGDIIVEADKAGDGAKPLVTNPNTVAACDYDFLYDPTASADDFEGARYLITPLIATEDVKMYTSKMSPMPAYIAALNKSRINGWFNL